MIRLLRHPRLFLSYAAEDRPNAREIANGLQRAGFLVFFDETGLIAGDSFPRRIVDELRRSDALVAIVSAHAAGSEWCQAELHHAHALGLPIVPIKIAGPPAPLAAPVDAILRDIHYEEIEPGAAEQAAGRIGARLAGVRRSVRRRSLVRRLLVVLAVAAIVAGAALALGRIDVLVRARDRAALLASLKATARPLSPVEIASRAERFRADEVTRGALLALSRTPSASDAARLNAWLITSRLEANLELGERWYVRDLDWGSGEVERASLANVTLRSGGIHRLTARGSTFSGVVWGPGAGDPSARFVVSGSRFVDCRFDANRFGLSAGVDVDFEDCIFRGSEVEIDGLSGVRFHGSEPENPHVVTDRLALFDLCALISRLEPPAPNVIDLSDPSVEVRFDNVLFVATQFRGWFKPEWFRRCTFRGCVLPRSLPEAELVRQGNRVDSCFAGDLAVD